jgi:hypothetical protein
LGDVAPPQLIHDPKVADLMAVALARGTPLSRDEVLQAFPDEDFESCHP